MTNTNKTKTQEEIRISFKVLIDELWEVVTDLQGNGLYGEGQLNENAQAVQDVRFALLNAGGDVMRAMRESK